MRIPVAIITAAVSFAAIGSSALAFDNPGSDYAAGTPGESYVPGSVPPSDSGGENPGTSSQPQTFPGSEALSHVPENVPAIGLRCLTTDWPPSSEDFRDCVRDSVTALRTAKRALRTDRTDSLRTAARIGCIKAGFSKRPEPGELRSEFGLCVSDVTSALRRQRARNGS
jgi:hypothetical protein